MLVTFESVSAYLAVHQKTITRMLVLIFSLSGFLAQVTWMSVLYFNYTTTTQVKLVMGNEIRHHSLALCVRYSDILDRERLFNETGIEMGQIMDIQEALKNEHTLTVKQIFEYTPKPSEVIDGCFYRPHNLLYGTGTRSEYVPIFNVSRYFTQEFMCYRIQPVVKAKLRTESVTQSRFKQFTIYDLQLTEVFVKAVLIMPITFLSEFPYLSRRYTELTFTKKDLDSSARDFNWFYISPSDFLILRMEPPYDTGCTNRPSSQFHTCRTTCLLEKFREWNRVPTSEIIVEPIDLFPMSYGELLDDDKRKKVDEAYDTCNDSCVFTECEVRYTKTRFRGQLFKDFSLALTSMTATDADIVTQAQATMTFVEYFSFVAGCFGTWFGISFFSLTRFRRLRMYLKVVPAPQLQPRRYRDKPACVGWLPHRM